MHTQTIGIVTADRDPLPTLARAFMASASRLNLEFNFGSAKFEPA